MMKMKDDINVNLPLIIVGASGFGKEVAWLAEECGVPVMGFADDNPNITGQKIYNYKVLGLLNGLTKFVDCQFVVAIGNPRLRKSIVEKLKSLNIQKFATLIHPSVQMSDTVVVGNGTVICSGCILTVDIEIGEHCQINLSNTIGHDCSIESFCTLAPQGVVSGNVTMNKGVEIGTGASIKQGVNIERGAMIGMGAIVVKNGDANTIYVGSPAKPLKKLEEF